MLVWLDVNRRGHCVINEVHRRNFCRLEGLDDEPFIGFVPANDIDLFAKQLVDDVLDSGASNSNAGTHAVYVRIGGGYRDLGSVSGLPGDLLDLDRVFLDFRDFEREKSAYEFVSRSRQGDLDPVGALLDIFYERLDPLSDAEALTGRLFTSRQETLDPAEADNEIRSFVALDNPGYQLPDLAFVFFKDLVAFSFPDFLEEHLLARHGGQASKLFSIDFLAILEDYSLPGFPVDHDIVGFGFPVFSADSGKQARLDSLEDDFFLNLLRSVDRVYKSQYLFGFHQVRLFFVFRLEAEAGSKVEHSG